LIISGSEDGCVKFWNANTFKIEDSKIFSLDKVWDIATIKDQNLVGLGCEEGTLVLRIGSEVPMAIFK
jgi:coatomer subunit beta'